MIEIGSRFFWVLLIRLECREVAIGFKLPAVAEGVSSIEETGLSWVFGWNCGTEVTFLSCILRPGLLNAFGLP